MNKFPNNSKKIRCDQPNFFSKAVFPIVTASCITVGSTNACAQDQWKLIKWDQKKELIYLKDLTSKEVIPTSIKGIFINNYDQLRNFKYNSSYSALNSEAKRKEIIDNGIGKLFANEIPKSPADRYREAYKLNRVVCSSKPYDFFTSQRELGRTQDINLSFNLSGNSARVLPNQTTVKTIDTNTPSEIKPEKSTSTLAEQIAKLNEAFLQQTMLLKEQEKQIEDLKRKLEEMQSSSVGFFVTFCLYVGLISGIITVLTADYLRLKRFYKYLFGWKFKIEIVRTVFN